VPVQTAGLADLNEVADRRRLHGPWRQAVHLQGLVAAPAVVVGEVEKALWMRSSDNRIAHRDSSCIMYKLMYR
jgi:hypothetical protein